MCPSLPASDSPPSYSSLISPSTQARSYTRPSCFPGFTPIPTASRRTHIPRPSGFDSGASDSDTPLPPSPRRRSWPHARLRTRIADQSAQTRSRCASSDIGWEALPDMSAPDSSPPPYSPTPPIPIGISTVPRASSSPHLRSSPSSPPFAFSSIPSTSSLPSHPSHGSTPPAYSHMSPLCTRGEDTDDTTPCEDDLLYTMASSSAAGTLRSRVLKRKHLHAETATRPISTVPGVLGAGETETEGEEAPRDLPTARITHSALTTFASSDLPTWFIPLIFFLARFLSIVPAIFGTLWNLYHVIWPPGGSEPDALSWRVDYFISVLWSILTGWQCLQLTTGLLKRWRVYYSPLPTLIRLFALQTICWPATHFTLALLNHEKRPALCWAVIGSTTCYSRSIQLWVTSNIGPAPAPAPRRATLARSSLLQSVLASAGGMREEWMKLRRRRWDWGEVGRKCVLPAGIVYFVMAWTEMLRKEWERAAR